eukprot:CAMPEP_0115748166 /NCGR_PEP_ID=MMETSP0272-20121206/93533_1 /TAXON_ID=71861 /ORGANISM="Scrippsiella trochoidea, Strain CCMP3099" /LENGTH=237 /DNA_ID=CAMNT_0003193171 /DNA_START=1 /DNA_END=712 /DNA_ORIENTATION=+
MERKPDCLMPKFDPNRSTTNDVVRGAIIPASCAAAGPCAYACIAHENLEKVATVMVKLKAGEYESLRNQLDKRDALGMSFWLCCFCVDQHSGICGSFAPEPTREEPDYDTAMKEWETKKKDTVTGEGFTLCTCGKPKHFNTSQECEMNKFAEMMKRLSELAPAYAQHLSHIIVVDEGFETLKRIWVLAEIHRGQELRLPQYAMQISEGQGQEHEEKLKNIRDDIDIRKCVASRAEDK